MFTLLALFSLAFLGSANGNWPVGNDDSYEGLKFYEMNLECNDALSECEHRFSGHFSPVKGLPLTTDHVLEYTKDPYELKFGAKVATLGLKVRFDQDDPSETFHFCSELTEDKALPVIGLYHGKWTLCLENDFSGLTIPADCTAPVAVSKIVGRFTDEKLAGQQVLYCMPS
ncbi:uncharacterized protein LOC119741710 [Patiria miniata]|uniref:Uncharacterized protein n=1 Tax=Patiria miniata TaxID=46514 RepID=A0A914BBB0_PATMI|nr:uncharacterized protein LOC119741710 [Patiria miniata]